MITRPVRRWKILLSKYAALWLMVSLILLTLAAVSYAIAGLVFGYSGWDMPLLIGFQLTDGELDTSQVRLIPQWKYIWMSYGFGWFVSMVVATISLMLSVLVKSTPTGMGIMLAALISGGILSGLASSWEQAKYLFSVNLELHRLSGRNSAADRRHVADIFIVQPFDLGRFGLCDRVRGFYQAGYHGRLNEEDERWKTGISWSFVQRKTV